MPLSFYIYFFFHVLHTRNIDLTEHFYIRILETFLEISGQELPQKIILHLVTEE